MPLGGSSGIQLLSSSVSYHLCGSAFTNATDNPSEMCPLNLKDFCLLLYHRSYKILQERLIPPMAFTSCHDWSSNLLPPDTLTTQPLRLAYGRILLYNNAFIGVCVPLYIVRTYIGCRHQLIRHVLITTTCMRPFVPTVI